MSGRGWILIRRIQAGTFRKKGKKEEEESKMPVAVETADVLTKLGIHDGYELVRTNPEPVAWMCAYLCSSSAPREVLPLHSHREEERERERKD